MLFAEKLYCYIPVQNLIQLHNRNYVIACNRYRDTYNNLE